MYNFKQYTGTHDLAFPAPKSGMLYIVWHEYFAEIDISINGKYIHHSHNHPVSAPYFDSTIPSGATSCLAPVNKGDTVRILTQQGLAYGSHANYPYPTMYVMLYTAT